MTAGQSEAVTHSDRGGSLLGLASLQGQNSIIQAVIHGGPAIKHYHLTWYLYDVSC